ncbi:hypothetical protein K2173_023194 [Erythroxylum novogranatense]|uniref:Vacuolar protein sorting-associated protein n=1 Tax=Erythroxylum novogranatense TaxID=1862640 RepID=A0AAV8UB84_9ROSI|nr:hypothetical protein K2173_023194 [Erythroxylum novogranatense]
MFEGLVHRVLVGYLGRFVKNFQKDKLKLDIWNEEIVLLENAELIPEAFDYLQLPFAVKQGRVGRLSLKVSWKRIGRESHDQLVTISIEDVFICVSQRDDQDWSLDAIERRELDGKKAQLAAAELAKLSKRVCENNKGKSFFSFIAAKAFDIILVSIKNLHVQYSEVQIDSPQLLLGLKFSSLTMKQNLVGSSVGGDQVNKTIEIGGFEIYCNASEGPLESTNSGDAMDYKSEGTARSDGSKFDRLLQPFNASLSLVFNRTGKLDGDLPHYSIAAELTGLEVFLNEVQLQKILMLFDYVSTSRLREKYGRYRPWGCPLTRKQNGWQKLWWHYAQESILSDVRQKLKKTSWRYLGQRLIDRQKYIGLYKNKLEFLQHEQSVDDYILRELEQIEKDSDVEDILNYRSAAEHELEELLSNSSSLNLGISGPSAVVEKTLDEPAYGKSRGWLNWLSLGMLGAGGTNDSSQFSGVVSDEVVQDIYEATEFHPSVLSTGDADVNEKMFAFAMKFSISQLSISLESLSSGQKIAFLVFEDVVCEFKLWEELATVICFINSGEILDPCNGATILKMRKSLMDKNVSSCKLQVDVSSKQEVGLSVKATIQPLELTCEMNFLLNFVEFFSILKLVEFQHDRVLSSLNGFEDTRTRLLAKAEYIFSNHKKLCWDVRISNISVNFHWEKVDSEQYVLVLKMESLLCTSRCDTPNFGEGCHIMEQFSRPDTANNVLMGFQVENFFNYFEVKINDVQLKLLIPQHPQTITILDKFSASITLASCIISDESILKQLGVYIILPSIHANFSKSIYEAILAFIRYQHILQSRSGLLKLKCCRSDEATVILPSTSVFGFFITAKLHSVSLRVDLENDGENSSVLTLSVQALSTRYAHADFQEFCLCTKALKVFTSPLNGESDSQILCLSGNQFDSTSVDQEGFDFNDECKTTESCFCLNYGARQGFQECTIGLNNTEIHCNPLIFGLLFGFYRRITSSAASFISDDSFSGLAVKCQNTRPGFRFNKFGFSNFFDTSSSDLAGISLDCYPFLTIINTGSIGNLECSLRYASQDWRKLLKLRNEDPNCPKQSSEKECKSSFDANSVPVSGSFWDSNVFNIDFNFSEVSLHFHDCSSVIGSVSLPSSKSSIVLYEDTLDLLFSTEGLILTSPQWTKNFGEFLWGPSLSYLPPVINVRIRKGSAFSLTSELEVSIGIQHVYCVLPPEYLAIIIGYFSLPAWSLDLSEQAMNEVHSGIETERGTQIVYKFEILDCCLILPVEQDDHHFLKVELPQLYASFVQNCASDGVLNDIPPQYMVSWRNVAKTAHCLNLFGRDLVLSLMLGEDDESGNTTLIAPLSADVWIRVPCESECSSTSFSNFTSIMSRISKCQLIADDCKTLNGFEALFTVINHLASVDKESKYFTSDVLHFLQLRRNLKENGESPPDDMDSVLTEIKCCVDSFSITLCQSRNEISSEPVAKVDLHFLCSASFINDIPMTMEFSFSSFTLHSLLNSVMMVQCLDTSSRSSALHISYTESRQDGKQLQMILPSLDIWLHIFDWIVFIDSCYSCAQRMTQNNVMEVATKTPAKDIVDPLGDHAAHVLQASDENSGMENTVKNERLDLFLTLKSEDIGVTIHLPAAMGESRIGNVQDRGPQNVSACSEGKGNKFIVLSTHSRSFKLALVGSNLKLKFTLEKICGSLGTCEGKSITNWPFFQFSQINVTSEICRTQAELLNINLGVQCDRVDVWLSHRVLCFWFDVQFDTREVGSPQSLYGSIDFRIQLRKASLLISDERWSSRGPLLEILLRNIELHIVATPNSIECSTGSHLEVNYNNIHKVLWEPFVEPWIFQIDIKKKKEMTAFLSSSDATEMNLTSTAKLNLNFTESLIECAFRTIEMAKDASYSWQPNELSEDQCFSALKFTENIDEGRYAPYVLQNFTSLPLVYHVIEGLVNPDDFDLSKVKDGKSVLPGASVPIFPNETPEELIFRQRPAQSSDRLNEKPSNGVIHHFMSIQLDGTSLPSALISMDRIGLTLFEVDFSKASNKVAAANVGHPPGYEMYPEENAKSNTASGFVVPVVFDVSVQRYSKLIRLYSTVILSNATSMPLELRFDIPFGVSPKILDPIYPGQEFPLPLHLAEAGRLRWRPLGSSYLWSEVYDLSSILSQESKLGFLRPFVCYPSHPSSDPFRCCMSVQNFSLLSSSNPKKHSSLHIDYTHKGLAESCKHDSGMLKKNCIHLVTLSTPLVVKNYLPDPVSLTLESAGVACTALLSQLEMSFYHIDPSHDVELQFYMHGFKSSSLKFPCTETFSTMAKFNGTVLSLTETITFDSDTSHGPLYVAVEKMMDVFSGARELLIFVPFLIYNCTGLPINIAEYAANMKEKVFTIPSCYNLIQQEVLQHNKDGLCLLASDLDVFSNAHVNDGLERSSSKNNMFVINKIYKSHPRGFICKPSILSDAGKPLCNQLEEHKFNSQRDAINIHSNGESIGRDSGLVSTNHQKAKACMYSPRAISSASEIMVRVGACLRECLVEKVPNSSWSDPFLLIPPSGSNTILVPQSSSNAAFIVSVTSNTIAGPVTGETRAIIFQPRYVICNACSKDLCYKQKGTDYLHYLDIGRHSHLHWTDTARELLVSIRFNEPGWQWSGSFSPDSLGDTQVKMRNYVSGALSMIRVEIQNADISTKDEKIVGSLHGNSGTNLILLSDDDMGFMPYRIDNFSKERLRVYQQRCETFDTIVQPYTSCPYAWDEPCYPHRLSVEVTGERVVGSYALDDLKEYMPVYLKSNSEKPKRSLLLSVHAEGATKVLNIVDSSCHLLKDLRDSSPSFQGKGEPEHKPEDFIDYKERFSFVIPYVGISLINACAQELLYASSKNISLEFLQSLDQQKLCFQISSLQIDNQLPTTPYPVTMSFNQEYKSSAAVQRAKDDGSKSKSEGVLRSSERSCEPVVYLALETWRRKDYLLFSFNNIRLRVADFCLDLDQELILGLLDFIKAASSRSQSKALRYSDSNHYLTYNLGVMHAQAYDLVEAKEDQLYGLNFPVLDKSKRSISSLPSVLPIGAPWQQIYLSTRRQKKIYVEFFDLAPINFTLSFSSAPWILRNGIPTSGESLIHRGLMALADVEGARIHLKQLTITHQMASWESMQGILTRHFMRQLLHEMYKSPAGLIMGMAQGTTSLVSNTVFAVSDAATQFSKAAHKGIVAFTFDDQTVVRSGKQRKGATSQSKGVINEVLEGLTGLLQAPIKEAEKRGLPGVLSGIALGVTGLVAKPAASILEVTGKTAQSIRNSSKLYQVGSQKYRIRLPRPLSRELPLRPYILEEAVGTSVLMEVDGGLKLKDEVLITCKSLKQPGKFVLLTERLMLVVSCSSLADIDKPEFRGIPVDIEWSVESEIGLDSVIHVDSVGGELHIVASSTDVLVSENQHQSKRSGGSRKMLWNNPSTPFPLLQTNLELASEQDAGDLLVILLSTIEQGEGRGRKVLHRSNIL